MPQRVPNSDGEVALKRTESRCAMEKIKVAFIFGGYSPEYDVSRQSAYSIIRAINSDKYEVILLGITRQGKWYRYSGAIEAIQSDTWHTDARHIKSAAISPSRGAGLLQFSGDSVSAMPVDVVFPVMHGKYGEDGTVQGLCELAGIPVVGSGTTASALCMDKDRAHKLASNAGILIPRSVCFEHPINDAELLSIAGKLKLPLFVKPVNTGSSFGISKIESYSELPEAVGFAFKFDESVIIEENIDGFEAGCAVVGNHDLITGRIDEIELTHGFFDYEEKYTLKTSKIHMPARIDAETERRLQETAKNIYRILGCRGYARVDMFLTKEQDIVFNEVNTIPGFTSHSRFPNMMKGIGIEYPALVDMLIEYGIQNSKA